MANNLTYYIGGVNVGVFDDATLVIEPFDLAMFGNDGSDIWQLTTTLYPDVRGVGVNGMDVNPNGQGNMPPDGCYDIYAIGNPSTRQLGFILTKAASWSDVVRPTGFTSFRKLMFGVLIHGCKLAPCHVSHWPMPRVDLTTPIIIAQGLVPSATWLTLNLSKLTPENARFVWYRCVFTDGPCNAWLSPSANTAFAKLVSYNQLGIYSSIGCRIQGGQLGYVQLFYGGKMDLYLEGWNQTEVS